MVQPLSGIVWKFLKTLKTEQSYNPAIPLLGLFPKKIKTLIGKDVIPMSTTALFTIAKIWKQPKCPSIEDGKEKCGRGFPGGSVVKNLLVKAGDTGLIPDPGRSHTLQSNQAHAPQLLCLSVL